MIPSLLIQIALIVIVARSAYKAFTLGGSSRKPWFDIAFHVSVALVALSFLL
ncbi:hypothetical protein [Paenibacillus flagellatus]|uniref:hypothetical protein n=1 Tax=Paenibacillus flagellatus TaxID=2211139 RepID=UPI0013050ECB|nr:hypothetical protein [Paenibacillus flagellatus]